MHVLDDDQVEGGARMRLGERAAERRGARAPQPHRALEQPERGERVGRHVPLAEEPELGRPFARLELAPSALGEERELAEPGQRAREGGDANAPAAVGRPGQVRADERRAHRAASAPRPARAPAKRVVRGDRSLGRGAR